MEMRMSGVRWMIGPLAAAALAVGALGCGSSDDDSTTGSVSTPAAAATTGTGADTTAATPAANAATGTPIKIGMLCTCVSPVSTSAGGKVPDLVKAWEDATNAAGGINGHPVSVEIKDDHNDPAKAVTAAKELVADKVIAVAPEDTRQVAAAEKTLTDAGIPVLGGETQSQVATNNANWFPTGSSLTVSVYGMLAQAVKQGKTKFGVVYCAEAPSCAGIGDLTKGVAAVIGTGSVVYAGGVAATAANYTSQCLAAKSAGVDAIWLGTSSNVSPRIVSDCAKQGFNPTYMTCCGSIGAVQNGWAPDGSIFSQTVLPVVQKDVPGYQAMYADLAKYAPSLTPSSEQFTDVLGFDWSGLALFGAAAQQAKLTPTSTSADVKEALYALKDETLGGITAPLNYVKGQPTKIRCWFDASSKGGDEVALSSTPSCVPADQVDALAKLGG